MFGQIDHEGFLTPQELAVRWQVPVPLLANWRYQRRGPSFTKLGHQVRYSRAEVERFERGQEVCCDAAARLA